MDTSAPSIRAQAKKSKSQPTDRSGDRSIIKPVLANPLSVPWPTLPKHLQTAAYHALKSLIPDDIPAYHTSRDRCRKKDKRQERTRKAREEIRAKQEARGVLVKGNAQGEEEAGAEGPEAEDALDVKAGGAKRPLSTPSSSSAPPAKKAKLASTMTEATPQPDAASDAQAVEVVVHNHPPNTQTPAIPLAPPTSLSHLVFGINETVKALERQTDALRVRIMQLGEALEAHEKDMGKGGSGGAVRGNKGNKGKRGIDVGLKQAEKAGVTGVDVVVQAGQAGLVGDQKGKGKGGMEVDGTASSVALAVDAANDVQTDTAQALGALPVAITQASPIEYILIPLPDLNPPTLAAHIPPYCATHNTLIYQLKHLVKVARARLPLWRLEEVGEVMGMEVAQAPTGVDHAGTTGEGGQEGQAQEAGHGREGGRMKVDDLDEVRVVPLGRAQAEISEAVGLRRVACVGVRTSHPDLSTLSTLLPKSVLLPPRYSLSLPFPIPTSSLSVHSGKRHKSPSEPERATTSLPDPTDSAAAAQPTSTGDSAQTATTATATFPPAGQAAQPEKKLAPATKPLLADAKSQGGQGEVLMPHVHYAPLGVKGLTTTVPADSGARKAKRMEEVRERRRARKEGKRGA